MLIVILIAAIKNNFFSKQKHLFYKLEKFLVCSKSPTK